VCAANSVAVQQRVAAPKHGCFELEALKNPKGQAPKVQPIEQGFGARWVGAKSAWLRNGFCMALKVVKSWVSQDPQRHFLPSGAAPNYHS